VPEEARRLRLRFRPAWRWEPPEPWCHELEVDLYDGTVVPHRNGLEDGATEY
jgi:hypothetical protein